MRFEPTELAGVVVVQPERHHDERGFFSRVFCEEEFARNGLPVRFPQTSVSFNAKAGTVRGMHFQREPHAEAKLVRCTRGAIYDVVVDLRPGQPTFGRWCGFELTPANGIALFIPEGFAHGFQALEDESELLYAITPSHVPGVGAGVRWDDPAIGVRWPQPVTVMSDKDRTWPLLKEWEA